MSHDRRRSDTPETPTRLSRRHALGLGLGLGLGAPLLASCGISTPISDRRPVMPEVPPVVYTRWSDKADGPMPANGDEGAPIQVTANDGPPPSVERGALVGNLPDAASAAYVVQPLTSKIRKIGAVFGFGPGSPEGSLTLIAWVPLGRPTAHCHVAFAPDRWVAATVEDADVDEFAGGDYRTPLVTDGRPYVVEVVIDGPTTHILLPDGTYASPASASVDRLSGVGPCWEFFRGAAGGAPALLYQSWAG